jgi:hypothetical protein
MSVSEKQLIANRKNAQKSTGPKTEEGKAISSKNALKHGLRSHEVILDSPHYKENISDFNVLLNSLFNDLKPVGQFQEFLVYKIANSLWRSRRAVIAETAQLHRQLDHVEREIRSKTFYAEHDGDIDADNPDEVAEFQNQLRPVLTGINLIPDGNVNVNILRYEMRLDRQLTRALRVLKYLQAGSKGKNNDTDDENTIKVLQI